MPDRRQVKAYAADFEKVISEGSELLFAKIPVYLQLTL